MDKGITVIATHKTDFNVNQWDDVVKIEYSKLTGYLDITRDDATTIPDVRYQNPENWLFTIRPIVKTV